MATWISKILIILTATTVPAVSYGNWRSPALMKDLVALRAPDSDYISSIEEDRQNEAKELILVPVPAGFVRADFKTSLFTDSLSKEFIERYREKLGYTEAEQNAQTPVDLKAYGDSTGYTEEVKRHREKQREFGEYMFRRLAEFHVDNYFKSEPKLKKVYEMKERLSNLDVRVNESTKLNTNYSFSGNFITATLENPYINARARFEMNPAQLGPGPVEETILSLYRNITETFSFENHYKLTQQILSLVGRKSFSERLQSTLTLSNSFIDLKDKPKESIALAGLLFVY
ncbi:MAG: hypothetical protein AB7F59_00210 [Bdellovibrionales bacterium]